MVSKIIIIALLICCSSRNLGRIEVVIEHWLTDDIRADFNEDGIVNFIDYAMASGYGNGKYGENYYEN